jgi:hypothetical protein
MHDGVGAGVGGAGVGAGVGGAGVGAGVGGAVAHSWNPLLTMDVSEWYLNTVVSLTAKETGRAMVYASAPQYLVPPSTWM